MINSVGSLVSSPFVGRPNLTGSSATQGGKETLKGVINELSDAVTGSDGQLDTDSPLGKMLSKYIQGQHPAPGSIKDALAGLIHSTLGENFGAASDLPGGGLGGGCGTSGASGSGQGDLMSQVLGGLGKAQMDSMLTDNPTRGGSDFTDADKPALTEVAKYMDKHPEEFGSPDDANGKVSSWTDEINNEGDTYLNDAETSAFRGAMDQIGQQMQSGNAQTSGMLGDSQAVNGGFGGGSKSGHDSELTNLLKGLEQSVVKSVVSELDDIIKSLNSRVTSNGGSVSPLLKELEQKVVQSVASELENEFSSLIKESRSEGNDSSSRGSGISLGGSSSGAVSSQPKSGVNSHFGHFGHGGQGGRIHHQSMQNDAQLAAGNVLSNLPG